jgi:hypothetical protein
MSDNANLTLIKFECPDFGVLCPGGGDAAIRTLEFVSNNFVYKISKKAKICFLKAYKFSKNESYPKFVKNCCIWNH